MSDTTMTDTEATDTEREAARQVIEIIQGIERGKKASRKQAAQWEAAVTIGREHAEREQFLNELCEQASAAWPDAGLMLKVFLSHVIAAQSEAQG